MHKLCKVQCVLSINLFNEKIFIFLWFWLCLVSIFNVLDLFSWVYTLIINGHDRYSYIRKRLSIINHVADASTQDRALFKKFVNSYLREDVILALRLLSRNSQDLIVSEIVANLFKHYKSKHRLYQQQQQRHQYHQRSGGGDSSSMLLERAPKSKSIVVDVETNQNNNQNNNNNNV